MWQGLDLIPHAPTFVAGEKYHPEAIARLRELGKAYEDAELGGVLVVSPDFRHEDAFPINPADPLEERLDWTSHLDLPTPEPRRWDGLPFLADAVQRAARAHGVATVVRPGPIDHAIWAPLRHMFPMHPMTILPVGVSELGPRSHFRMGRAIRDAVVEAPKPIAVLVSANLTSRPDLARASRRELPPEGRAVDAALLKGLRDGDWTTFDGLDDEILKHARPEGGRRLWAMLRGLTAGLAGGDVRYYGPALGAFGMALVHYEPERRAA